MSTIKKCLDRFYKKPIPNDISFEEIELLANYFGCEIKYGGNHPKVAHRASGTIIPIPRHGKCVDEVYIKQLKLLFDEIQGKEESK